MKKTIQPIGNYLSQDENGFIINDLEFKKLAPKWQEILQFLTQIYLNELGEHLHSVYVRGSVARNLAIDGISDLDTFALLKPTFANPYIRWERAVFQENTRKKIEQRFAFRGDLEMMLSTYDESFKNSRLAMIVKTQSILILGEDIFSTLKKYKPNYEMCLNRRWFLEDIDDFLTINPLNFTPKNCSDIMKLFLRTGFELIIERVKKFSPDLYICYRDFCIFYPNKASEMRQVLIWYLNPISDKKELDKFVFDFSLWFKTQLI